MATLSSNSTDAEVWAAYDDNASYEQDASRVKALAFVTACRILRRRLPLSAGRGPQSVTRESLDAEISAGKAWLDAHPAALASGPRGRSARRTLRAADRQSAGTEAICCNAAMPGRSSIRRRLSGPTTVVAITPAVNLQPPVFIARN